MRRHLLTIDEIAQAFREELTRRHKHPSKAQLAVLLLNLSGPIAQLDLDAFAALSPISRAAADFSHHGWHTYQAIEAITALRPDWLAEMPILAQSQESFTGGGGAGAIGTDASGADSRERATIAAWITPHGIFRRESGPKVPPRSQPVTEGLTYERVRASTTHWSKVNCAIAWATRRSANHLPKPNTERSHACDKAGAQPGKKFKSIDYQDRGQNSC